MFACGTDEPPSISLEASRDTADDLSHCDRQCLEAYIDQFLEALAGNDPSGLPLADDVIFVENNQRLELGDGSWRTITGLGKYRHYFADPKTGQVAVITVIEENGTNIMYDLRLAIAGRRITEIEALVIRSPEGAKLLEETGSPWPEFLESVPVDQRVTRNELIATANKYLTGMENNTPDGDYSFFADDCDRLEHGVQTTNNKPSAYGHSTDKEFVTMSCREQFETGFLGFVTRIRDRRFVVVDEERQTVFGFVILDHNGTIRRIDMSNDRVFVIPPYFSTPRTLLVGEAWRIRKDKLFKIEMTLSEIPYGNRPRFGRDDGNWLKYTGQDIPDSEKDAGHCERGCLEKLGNDLLDAMLAHDPARLPLSSSLIYTENGQRLSPGDGLWGTLSGLEGFKLLLTDEERGNVGIYANIIETDVPGLVTARLRIDGNQITEIEVLVVREEYAGERGGTLTLFAPRQETGYQSDRFPATLPSIPESEPRSPGNTATNAELKSVVEKYYAGLSDNDGRQVPFTENCLRRINGVVITRRSDAGIIDPDVPGYKPFSMTCAAQIDAGVFNYISRTRDRRLLVSDPARGLLMDMVFYDVSNPALPIKVKSFGSVQLPPPSTGPYTLMATQLFRIEKGEILGIETVMLPVPYGMTPGW